MKVDTKHGYPDDWKVTAARIKSRAAHRCERCGHPDDTANGYTLTVHHLDADKSNCQDWNLAALCQRCHLRVQRMRIPQLIALLKQTSMFDFLQENWLLPHLQHPPDIKKADT